VRACCTTRGFQDTFTVTGAAPNNNNHNDNKTILAMDSSIAESIRDQCSGPDRDRDILKAVTAFSSVADNGTPVAIATGHWGCGAFGGDIYCKFLVQLIAASLCRRRVTLVYCLVGDDSMAVEDDFAAIYAGIQRNQWGPRQVYEQMAQYRGRERPEELRQFVLQKFAGV